ncbi:MAG TPA: TIGR04282 family arsenosugar biosynthesis glycosyltransferase [Solirubrobacteraceae bacterium]|nr:TIGR04282 family arsenosugar biosynthesis glycosyltransferase [Solirubrobacteraceae bacterium]
MTGILIMAKAPRPGETKTRLEPLLGPDGCARLQTELIRHATAWATRATRHASLAFTPTDARAQLAQLVPRRLRLFPQTSGDLGARLRVATELAFRGHHGPRIVIGTDAPELGVVHLQFAEQALAAGADACLVPALDGGYALIALTRPTPAAFDLPPDAWGGPDVLALTMTALGAAGCTTVLLDPVRDLDTPADACHIAADPRCPEAVRRALCDPSPK